MAPAAEARARMSCGSIACAGSGVASVTSPTTARTMAISWNQGAWRSMAPSISQADFPPGREMSGRAAAGGAEGLEDRDRVDRRPRHVRETERGDRQQELPPPEASRGAGQVLEIGVVDEPEP